jgi:hypothetical protein
MKGINLATASVSMILEHRSKGKKCVFLSHKSEDKEKCIEIGEFLTNSGINIYLDANDTELQIAWANQDVEKMTNCIKKGIKESTHMLCMISHETKKSKWVPFEIGYAHSALVDTFLHEASKRLRISILRLEDVAEDELPHYLTIVPDIKGAKSLEEYIADYIGNISKSSEQKFINESKNLRLFSKHNHPLYGILNLNK